ncbi:hypothetical protein NKW85_09865 [Staphylococcus simulans]|uniref:hypothetical protein n=1 Tax=Staphylococcus simulans TaxID=1286 RepID=UPI000D031693|nr:hypothetical protein [Staphylococcus simulans]PTJ48676.1 hypothetical protein BU014_03320 [Staphylococcus simulans]PTJ85519.1 hypothetical protein BU051_08450 [Staphylococcus simulans]RIN67154.1 hypothetical protein BU018_05925 [Staphylococcus simulans]UXR34848.1 hypothetical protein MUA31_10725 [Staphylococcus simulans]
MMEEDKYVSRYEWEKSKSKLHSRINEVDNKHLALHNDLKLLVTRLNDSNDALIQSQLTTNKTLEKINNNLSGFNDRIKDVEHISESTVKRLDSIESFVSERQKGNMQIWVAIIGAIATVLVGALGFAATFF